MIKESEEVNCRKCGSKLRKGTMKLDSQELASHDCPKCGSRYVTNRDAMAIEKRVKIRRKRVDEYG